jgi:hypothetical protein
MRRRGAASLELSWRSQRGRARVGWGSGRGHLDEAGGGGDAVGGQPRELAEAVEDEQPAGRVADERDLGFRRTVASGIEVPTLLVTLVRSG